MTRKPRIYMKFLVFYVVFQSIIKVFVFGETNKYSSKTTVEQVNLSDYRKTLSNDVVCHVSCKNIYKTHLWTVAFHPLGCWDSVVAPAASGPAVGPGGGVLTGGVLAGGGAATDHSHSKVFSVIKRKIYKKVLFLWLDFQRVLEQKTCGYWKKEYDFLKRKPIDIIFYFCKSYDFCVRRARRY